FASISRIWQRRLSFSETLGLQHSASGYCGCSADSCNHKTTGESKHKHPKRGQGRQTLKGHTDKATTIRNDIGKHAREQSHSQNNGSSQQVTTATGRRELLQHAHRKSVVVDILRRFAQLLIKPIFLVHLVHPLY